jgi:protein O-mannosyl-transferase
MLEHKLQKDDDVTFKGLFLPLTTKKAIVFIFIIGFVVFFNMLFNGFVWDDKSYILDYSQIHSINIPFLFGANLYNIGSFYRPLTALYFSIEYILFKDNSFYYHLFQLILHISSAALLFLLFKKFLNKTLSLLICIIFLVHPIQVESVSFIAASNSPLSFVFGITGLLLCWREKIHLKHILLAFIFILISILIKEAGILFIFILLLYRLIFNKRESLKYFIGGLITIVIYLVIRFGIGKVYLQSPVLAPIARLPLDERLINIPAIIVYYLKTFFAPVNLAIDQFWFIKKIDIDSFYAPLFIVIFSLLVLILAGIYILKTDKKMFKIFLFFLIWFIAGLFLYIQIFPLDMTVADRWFYFPIVGLLGILGVFLYTLIIPFEKIRVLVYVLIIIFIILLSGRTIIRNSNWIDNKTLYTHDSQVLENFDIENSLGNEYVSLNNYNEALKHFSKSAMLLPYETNLFNIGSVYEKLGNVQKAKEYYSMALAKPHFLLIPHKHIVYTYQRFAYVLLLSNDFVNARKQASIGLKDYPNDANLLILLALSEYKLNNQSEALSIAKRAKILYPVSQTNYIYSKILNKQAIDIPSE